MWADKSTVQNMSSAELQSVGEEQNGDLELGEVMELLRSRRRRVALDYLEREGPGTFGDLVEYAAKEIHGLGYGTDERKRLYVALYQNHLPKLDDAGVVEFEGTGDEDRVRPGENYDRIRHILDSIRAAAEEESVEADSPRPVTRTLSDLLRGGSGE